MEHSRKLRRELSLEFAKLNGLQKSVDLTLHDAGTKALATEVRKQAGICLQLLDKYQLSMPGRMRSYAESKCQRFREDLRQTEMRFRDASGEFERRILQTERRHAGEGSWGEVTLPEEALDDWDARAHGREEEDDTDPLTSPVALSRYFIEVQNGQDIDRLMELVDDDVEFKLAFDPPLLGKAAVRRQYERDWGDHENTVVYVNEVFERNEKVAVEIHVDSGPPSNVLYNGVVVHRWNDEGRLTHYQLYVDEVTSAEGPA